MKRTRQLTGTELQMVAHLSKQIAFFRDELRRAESALAELQDTCAHERWRTYPAETCPHCKRIAQYGI